MHNLQISDLSLTLKQGSGFAAPAPGARAFDNEFDAKIYTEKISVY